MIKVTDDFKIMINRAIVSIKDEDKESFTNSIKYIIEQLEYKEYDVFIEYLFNKIINEVKMNREQKERLIEKIEYDIKSDMIVQEEKKKIKRSECPYGGIDCAWCDEDCE